MKSAEFNKRQGQEIGSLFAAILLGVGIYPLLNDGDIIASAVISSFCLLVVTVLKPSLLSPIYKLWMLLAKYLHKIVTPLVLGLIFFVIFTPIGFLMRVAGKDLLCIGNRFRSNGNYWRQRPKDIQLDMTKQF
ncbi:MAG: SxtJ family membrane protein [Nitrospinota bacterium]|nr:SxtJ family membrane protein [Nitrospinota bacterium]